MLGKLICLFAVVSLASCMQIQTGECVGGKSAGQDITMTIEPCTAQPCALTEGQAYAITVHFKPTNAIKTLSVGVRAKVYGFWVPYSIDKPDACKDSGLTCPIAAGAVSSYEYSLKLSTYYPAIDLVLEWKMTDDSGATQVCKQFPLSVKKASKKFVVY